MINKEAKNWDFFDSNHAKKANCQITEAAERIHNQQDKKLLTLIEETKTILKNNGFQKLAQEIENIRNALQNDKFKISVVGEFSRGKSTFINNFLGRKILPVSAVPTTAILTKVIHNSNEMIMFVNANGEKKTLPLEQKSWTGLTANHNGNDIEGVAFVGLNSSWLAENGIEIVDTPGVNDTNEKRILLTNDALLCGNGAIIAVSATKAMSITEEEFIKQRILFTKVPYFMLILTMLDTIKEEERADVIQNVKNKLELWNANIPVFIPQDNLNIPGMDYSKYTGIEAIKAEITNWANDAEYQKRKRTHVCIQILSIMQMAESSFAEKEQLLKLDEDKRKEALNQKKFQLSKIQLHWEELQLEILKRCSKCFEWLKKEVQEKQKELVECLQFEASHANNPQKWWTEDYLYRLKIEMSNLAVSIESGLTQNYTNDVKWLNGTLAKQFKSSIFVEKEIFADKSIFKESKSSTDIKFENIDKIRTWSRIGLMGAMTIAAFIVQPAGVLVGTGGGLISEKIFKDKIDRQLQTIKETIAIDVPKVIDKALTTSEQRLQSEYNHLIKETSAKEKLWIKSQLEDIESYDVNVLNAESEDLAVIKASIINQIQKINQILEDKYE